MCGSRILYYYVAGMVKMKFRLNWIQPRLILPFLCFLALINNIMQVSSACPRSGEYVGEYRGMDWILCPGGVLGISSDGDNRMEPKVKTQKNH